MKDETKTIVEASRVMAALPGYQPYSYAEIDAVSKQFYVAAMESLNMANIPFLVGGAYAFAHYAKIDRHTKDFDIFVKKEDADRVLVNLSQTLKCKIDRTFPHWLYKSIMGENFIDVIFRYAPPPPILFICPTSI